MRGRFLVSLGVLVPLAFVPQSVEAAPDFASLKGKRPYVRLFTEVNNPGDVRGSTS